MTDVRRPDQAYQEQLIGGHNDFGSGSGLIDLGMGMGGFSRYAAPGFNY